MIEKKTCNAIAGNFSPIILESALKYVDKPFCLPVCLWMKPYQPNLAKPYQPYLAKVSIYLFIVTVYVVDVIWKTFGHFEKASTMTK